MKKLTHLMSACLLSIAMLASHSLTQAQDNMPRQGAYRVLPRPQPVEADGKVEVIEFFWYNCHVCNDFEPIIAPWAKAVPKDIIFKRVPVVNRDDYLPQARTYYALESLGKVDELHKKFFLAIHSEKKPLNTVEQISAWMATQGLDKDTFMKAYSSFSVQSKANRAKQMTEAFEIDSFPTLAVGGKYLTSPALSQGFEASLKTVEQLAAAIKAKKL